jgi:hypothetical protein
MTRDELEQVIYERTRDFVGERVLDCILELIADEREKEREEICKIIYESCIIDNNVREIFSAIRARG